MTTTTSTPPTKDLTHLVIDTTKKDPRHDIPSANFFTDIPQLTTTHGAENLITTLQSLKDKYTFFQQKLNRQRQLLQSKIPDLTRAISVITTLQRRLSDDNDDDPLKINYEIGDSVYAKGVVRGRREGVALWLGAGVMVEYGFGEARVLLEDNLKGAKKQLEACEMELAFIRDQSNVVDVNMTRIYNAHVVSSKEKKKKMQA